MPPQSVCRSIPIPTGRRCPKRHNAGHRTRVPGALMNPRRRTDRYLIRPVRGCRSPAGRPA
jgi:hypothetical protein